jgi:hypothetical protein
LIASLALALLIEQETKNATSKSDPIDLIFIWRSWFGCRDLKLVQKLSD